MHMVTHHLLLNNLKVVFLSNFQEDLLELKLGWTPLAGQYFGVLKVLLRLFLVTVVIVYLNWCSVVKCLMNSFLIVEAKIPTNSFFCFPNRLVIIDIHFLVLH